MHDDVTAIKQHPASVGAALQASAPHTSLSGTLFDGVSDGLDLAWIRASANDKIIRDNRELADVKDDDIGRFFVVAGVRESAGQLGDIQT